MSDLLLDRIHATDGITVPNFFNGRILSAEDLRMLLDGDRSHRRLLGRAIGRGVADGLRVSSSAARSVTVGAGLAINGHGETVVLPADVTLDVSGTSAGGAAEVSAGVFLDCDGPAVGTSGAEHAYVLTIRPDSTIAGSAPADVAASGASCGPGYVREGARFRRVAFDPNALWTAYGPGSFAPNGNQVRNVLAHLFLSSWLRRVHLGHPFDRSPLLNEVLADVGVEPCEVPLATFLLSGSSVQRLDMWGVRRRIHLVDPAGVAPDATVELPTSDIRRTIGEATLHQFQAQLADELAGTSVVTAAGRFPFLPAAGLLPAEVLGTTSNPATFAAQTSVPFFAGVPHERLAEPLAADRVEGILRRGTEMPVVHPALGLGTPVQVALVEQATGEDPYAVFFGADHPVVDRIRIDELVTRIEELEARIESNPSTGPSVTVIYRPGKGRIGAGGVWSQALLGADPELSVGESGLLRFDVVVSETGEYQFDLDVSEPKRFRVVLVQANFVGVEFEVISNPHTRTLNAGTTTTVLIQVTVPDGAGFGGGFANRLFGGPSSLEGLKLPESLVTLQVASTSDATVKDTAAVAVKVVP